ncbi:MAG: carboxypeptidase regulatory-like domain-containing protein [Anaerolineae bacterium]|nr:carboxypeptidase regulatory-like domain-containing protein [Anaerolineae bacterium]
MNRGYAIGFLIVLLVIILGLYVAFTGFMSTRDALRAQATAVPTSAQAQVTQPPTEKAPSPTPGIMVLPTPVPGITATLTAVASAPVAAATEAPAVTEPAETRPTSPPPLAPTQTSPPTPRPPTAVPVPAYAFRVAAPPGPAPDYPICCYIFGTVRDAAGNPLEGVQVKAFNDWNTDLAPALTKGGGEAGQYNIPISQEAVTWYVMVVDAAGNQASPQVAVQFNAATAGGYRIDWQRTY